MALDVQQIISQSLCFLLLFFVMKRFAWGPLLRVLDARQARIQEDLRSAAQTKEQMTQMQEDLGRRLAKIDEETRAKIQESIREGRRIATEIQEQAREQAQSIISKSQETVAMELAKAKVSLRDQVAEMTVTAVEQVLREKLDVATDQRLVNRVVAELEESR